MNLTHTTKEGQTLMIAEMDNNHLKNTVTMILKGVEMAKEVLKGKELDPFKKALYSSRTPAMSKTQAKKIIATAPENVSPYILECVIRGIDFSVEIRKTFDRTYEKEKFPDLEIDKYLGKSLCESNSNGHEFTEVGGSDENPF